MSDPGSAEGISDGWGGGGGNVGVEEGEGMLEVPKKHPPKGTLRLYPLARSQYINNSPGFFERS